ncbi:MAG TPA: OmpA family protein [Mucilaginibacter sp.]|jgi:OOP family OmpA-OmpF porin|nr:OmpA family protein [Mucilaginibacter sp.]
MKTSRISIYIAIATFATVAMESCHSKKLVTKTAAPVDNPAPPVARVTPPATPPPAPKPAPAPAPKPDYTFTNIQFDFNSAVLRTDAIQYLDHVVTEMKLDPSKRFMLNGYASAEGTAAHNLQLSKDRANSVKQYLVNAGINNTDLSTKGWGTKHPIASNDTESGKEQNRRVEVKLSM